MAGFLLAAICGAIGAIGKGRARLGKAGVAHGRGAALNVLKMMLGYKTHTPPIVQKGKNMSQPIDIHGKVK